MVESIFNTNHASCGVGVLADLDGKQTHRLVENGFEVLLNLDHRGARGAEENTGDGAGMLLQKPHDFFREVVPGLGDFNSYAVGQAFMPLDPGRHAAVKGLIETICKQEGFDLIDWRDVPTNNGGLGKTALDSEPLTQQFFVRPKRPLATVQLDVRLYVLRRVIENEARNAGLVSAGEQVFYICSLSRATVVYKGLLTCGQLKPYYPDLSDERVISSLVLVHARFSTNTLGAWDLAHPYRFCVHNGEINTLRGNQNWMRAREADLASPRFGADIEKIKPIVASALSDSAVFDNVLELLVLSGRNLAHALRMLIPEAWQQDAHMDPERRAIYEYHSALMEPWDGPALVVATDGERMVATLDRNGLRPCRYCVTRDRRLIMSSETGSLEVPAADILHKGRLRPGQLFVLDAGHGGIVDEGRIFAELAERPYARWLKEQRVRLADVVKDASPDTKLPPLKHTLPQYQRAFGYTIEGLRVLVQPMAEFGKDPIGAMGNDSPLAVLSACPRPLSHYFLQQFAQVSNPPLDYIREALVTSLMCPAGRQRNVLEETAAHCRQLLLDSPLLSQPESWAIEHLDINGIRTQRIATTYPSGQSMGSAITGIYQSAERAIREGYEILMLCDRDIGPDRIAVPSLLAASALHHHLVRTGRRTRTAIVVSSGEPYTVHHFCTLLGYGVDAIYPWLAYQSIKVMTETDNPGDDPAPALARYRDAVESGILKVMSKMGISTLQSYRGAQIFEAVGLNRDFIKAYFTGTTARIPGVGLAQIEKETREAHAIAFGRSITANLSLRQGGEFYWRRDGELHHWNPYTIGKLQQAARNNDAQAYRDFADFMNNQNRRLLNLRGLLAFNEDPANSVPLQNVESVESIMRRFSSGSMSFGALSQEAHETMAIAMNRINGKAGSGEGGEQEERFGTERENSMKQVASARFGVTAYYLAMAKQIEIKMAQGSKPGEGGELPGAKVDEGIARVRFTVPGVGLISPPPHHDIYSIEDLAQLIHDLKCANPTAEIHVKLVAKAGVGTIAAGVAKARADAVLISGDSGGTGASVKTSIKSAGAPWELGLAETHRVLLSSRLRSRITVRTDGGLLTGRDVIVAALLGAEEYGFGTAPLVACGCIMLRKCHCNTCSVGVATQDPRLRKKFTGTPEHVINYMRFIAEEVRGLMAKLGFLSMEEMIGRVDKLQAAPCIHSKGIRPDVSELLIREISGDTPHKTREQNHHLMRKIDHRIIEAVRPAIEKCEAVTLSTPIRSRDLTFGTLLSYTVTRRHGSKGLPPGTIKVNCTGSAGQSFGAFLCCGINLHLEGDANDYIGKGLSGGLISVRVPADSGYVAAENVIIGNVALFGATAGEGYFNGLAGERFCVRNSGALSVVEGVGDHACEYMTGGIAVILGPIGKNFAAGMSGGEAFVLDEAQRVERHLNRELVHLEPVREKRDQNILHRLLENHASYTGSVKARELLDCWQTSLKKFVKVVPDAYAEAVANQLAKGQDIRIKPPPPATNQAA